MSDAPASPPAAPDAPARPLVIYDGDCGFCRCWVDRWRRRTGDAVEYAPLQAFGQQVPGASREALQKAVHLVLPDGRMVSGAAAVLALLTLAPDGGGRLIHAIHWAYARMPGFALVSEAGYRVVARNRNFFSRISACDACSIAPLKHDHTRRLFMRALALVYFCAFASMSVQIIGLVGRDGIWPAERTVEMARTLYGNDLLHNQPTLFLLNASDAALRGACWAGMGLSVALLLGIAPPLVAALLWVGYLSIAVVGGPFLNFQWDALLLETGLIAIFYSPWQWLPRRSAAAARADPSRAVVWLLRLLIFKLMFESGLVKLASHDAAWRGLTAMTYHYWTQPLPTWTAWYVNQFPLWFHQAEVLVMFAIELGAPWLIFFGRRGRLAAFWAFVSLQLLIGGTGNYGYFNLLTIVLCIPLLDDSRRVFRRAPRPAATACTLDLAGDGINAKAARPKRRWAWPAWITWPVTAVWLSVSAAQALHRYGVVTTRVPYVDAASAWLHPMRCISNYGLFAVMTTTRREIVIETSVDGQTWTPIVFKYKPGDPARRPAFIGPHMPRLDWQMWFAALGSYRSQAWFIPFCRAILEGRPTVRELLAGAGPAEPRPQYLRATVYEYHFSDAVTREQTGAWWVREMKGLYCPVLRSR